MRRRAILLLAPAAVLAAVFAPVRPTNFAGLDEWLTIDLVTRGLFGFPYASRPLDLLLTMPGAWLAPNDVWGYLAIHELYLAAGGALAGWMAWRWLRLPLAVCLMSGVLTAVWAPLDSVRLNAIIGSRYSGTALGVLLAAALFVAGWRRWRAGRPRTGWALAATAAALAVALVLGLEAALTLLAGVPLIAWASRPRDLATPATRRKLLVLSACWLAVLAAAAAPLALAMLRHGQAFQYQDAMGLDPHPLHVALRIGHQLDAAVRPAFAPRGMLLEAAWPAALFVVLLIAMGGGREGTPARRRARRVRLARAAALGAALALLSWSTLSLSSRIAGPARGQMLSAPGTALLLASLVGLVASFVPARAATLALALGGAWMVAVAADHTAALQREWDHRSRWTPQRASLVALIERAPAFSPNTLVVVLDDARSWHASFDFRHAVRLLYGPHVVGFVWNAYPTVLYPTRFEDGGVDSEPWPSLRGPWQQPPTHHRYDEVVVVRWRSDRSLAVLGGWPATLPALPPGAVYAPQRRIIAGPAPVSRRILDRER